MEIEEFKKHKHNAEERIAGFVSSVMSDFRNETGYSLRTVDISLICFSKIGVKDDEYLINNVHTEVDL